MATSMTSSILFFSLALTFSFLYQNSFAARTLTALVEEEPPQLTYHKGALLAGPITVSLVWYGKFTSAQRSVVSDFVASLSSGDHQSTPPSVSAWWRTTEKYYSQAGAEVPALALGEQILDESYSLGKSLKDRHVAKLARKGLPLPRGRGSISVVLTSADVAVEGFCSSRCGTHSSARSKSGRFAYVWVGDSAEQCPGYCAWPFHRPIYGPQSAPLVAPNGDVGADGMVVNLAGLLVGAVTNPFGDGFFQGTKEAPLEAASACPGIYGKGAYPGYAGELLVDPASGASYNVNGARGRRYLVPALFDPATSSCSTMVSIDLLCIWG